MKILSWAFHSLLFEPFLVAAPLVVQLPSTSALERQTSGGAFWPRSKETSILVPALLPIFRVTLGKSWIL